jgi:hypothetical protein
MKLRIPLFDYEFEVTQKGIKPVNKTFQDADDKELYMSILEGLNVDFKNAPIDTGYNNILQQKAVYVMKTNRQYNMEVDEVIKITTGEESLKPQQFVEMMKKMSPNTRRKPANLDLQ